MTNISTLHPFDDFDDAAADRWTDAVLAALRGQPCPADDADSREGYQHGLDARKVRVTYPARPEGYYHTNPNGEV
jgi:hypothetical protein